MTTAPAHDALTGVWDSGDAVDPADLRHVAGAFPSGVTVVTTMAGETPIGLTVSSFASVSLHPPLLLVCIARRAASLPAFRPGVALGINVLACGQAALARSFGGRHEDKFAGVAYHQDPGGAPLLEGAAAWLACRLDRLYDGGDHVILLARVQHLHRGAAAPLLYHSGVLHDSDVWAAPPEPSRSVSTPATPPTPGAHRE